MARIVEDIIAIKFSKIVKDSEDDTKIEISDDTLIALEQVAQELIGSSVVVEAIRSV